ncbi:MAG: DUF2793 domain-containing protein [Sphingomonadaceae bacterium]|uniref:DUF2793 domain-containing protein n=1 Tax=Thermaurantiacus sp. TaxID=2820283 RepID=UPI00298ED175|nr:DUF2793 domain-containing protein [Thermaurantiacus sp.]MCS6987777.1 DUF2793 domain-containing protein [Sphingomonadaceae bacterium]MDW8415003.1 DUF2793 domain-containing protein [Thermaurantiacus sp.]
METTPRHALPLLLPGQAQKDVTHNEALLRIDALLFLEVERTDLGAPPAAPAPGQCWLVADPATGAWEGQAGRLAVWTLAGWRFLDLGQGVALRDRASGRRLRRTPSGWVTDWPMTTPLAAVQLPAGGAVVDAEARAAIAQILGRLQALGLLAG